MLISNFGHLWERRYINYGGSRVKGHLKGYITGEKTADFRDQIGIYVLFDAGLVPVYIGQAGQGQRRLLSRLNQHETDHLWNRWHHFSWFGFRRVNKNGSLSRFDDVSKLFKAPGHLLLNEIEGALITALEPKLNKQGARWKDVKEYYQTIDGDMREATVGDLLGEFEDSYKLLQRIERKLDMQRVSIKRLKKAIRHT
jgi:hypothetical protein